MNAHCDAVSTQSSERFLVEKSVQLAGGNPPRAISSVNRGLLTRAIDRFKTYLHVRKMRRIDRDAFRHLAKLDDSILQDIGVTRADVAWAIKLPLSQNASEALQLVSRGYKQRA